MSTPPQKKTQNRIKQGFGREFSIGANSGMSLHLTTVRGAGGIFLVPIFIIVLMKRKIICDIRWEIPGMGQGFQASFSFLFF